MSSGRVRIFVIFLIVWFAVLNSCGLSKPIYLNPPIFSSDGANGLTLSYNGSNYDASEGLNQSFKGFEIYYRAYDNLSAATTAVTNLQQKLTDNTNSPQLFINSVRDVLGFSRIKSESAGTSIPLIPITSAGSNETIRLLTKADTDWIVTLTNPDNYFSVFRNVIDDSRKSFYRTINYLATDTADDYSGVQNPTTIYFVFFAVSYGKDPEEVWLDIYSLPDSISQSNIISYTPLL